jgi:hypothetical protein
MEKEAKIRKYLALYIEQYVLSISDFLKILLRIMGKFESLGIISTLEIVHRVYR